MDQTWICVAGKAWPHGSRESGSGSIGSGHCGDAGKEGGDSGAAPGRCMAAGLSALLPFELPLFTHLV